MSIRVDDECKGALSKSEGGDHDRPRNAENKNIVGPEFGHLSLSKFERCLLECGAVVGQWSTKWYRNMLSVITSPRVGNWERESTEKHNKLGRTLRMKRRPLSCSLAIGYCAYFIETLVKDVS